MMYLSVGAVLFLTAIMTVVAIAMTFKEDEIAWWIINRLFC